MLNKKIYNKQMIYDLISFKKINKNKFIILIKK